MSGADDKTLTVVLTTKDGKETRIVTDGSPLGTHITVTPKPETAVKLTPDVWRHLSGLFLAMGRS